MSAGTWLRSTIGDYRLIEFIGAGGMGEVYRGVHLRTGRPAAVKILTAAGRMPSLTERFRNEARIQALLQHPNIAALEEFLEHEGTPCILMEYVDGETLEQRVRRRGALPEAEACLLAAAVTDAVSYLHARGIIHRDIKPSNVKLTSAGVVKLLDFGIAKGPGSPALTTQGSVIGTLQSLAPEQLSGAPASRVTDIWSLGVLLYELATGRHPFAHDRPEDITARIRAAQYPLPSQVVSSVSPALDRIIGRCLRVRPRDRYQSCEQLLADLRDQLQPKPLAAAPSGPARSPIEMLRAASRALPGSTGALRAVRPHLSLALALVGLVVAVGFLISSLPGPRDRRGNGGNPDPNPGPVSPVRAVTINTVAGVAEVWRNGRLVDRTPYQVRAAIGERVSVILKRAGYEDEPVEFEVTEGRTEYSIVMRLSPGSGRPAADRSPDPPDEPPPPPLLPALAWFALPWRRRRAAAPNPRPEALTVDRPLPPDDPLGAESRIIVGTATDPGCVREINEDAVRVVRSGTETIQGRGLLAAVLDGMGGHAAGEVASRIAADELTRHYADDGAAADPGSSLARAVQAANRAVFTAANGDPALKGMGTTCTALVVRGGLAWCAHVGDSRCYLVRGDEIFLMTEDHSAVMAMVRDGTLSRDQARQHPDKNVISRALGSHREVEVTQWPRPFVVHPGDRFLLCSDGLHDLAGEEEVRRIVAESPPHRACERLVELARERGAPDNVSCVILAMPEGGTRDALKSTRDLPAVPA